MGYERNDRGYGQRSAGYDANRFDRTSEHYDRNDPRDRGFFERAGDEVRSWFGDEEAERRRHYDEQFDDRFDRDRGRDETGGYAGFRSGREAGADYPRYARSNSANDFGAAPRAAYGYQGGAQERTSGSSYGDGRNADRGHGSPSGRDWRENEYRALYGRDGASSTDRDARRDDPHGYHSWRSQQIDSFDRDYDEYRRENQSRFASEFSAWRDTRQTQRNSLRQAKEHQEVLGSDGQHVGTVDHVRGDRILLTKTDKDAGGHHHSIPSSWIQTVDDKVHLSRTADQAQQAWRDEETNRGLFGGSEQSGRDDHQGERGAPDLNRSFSGTY